MPINDFSNSPVLSIYQGIFKKIHDRKNVLNSKFPYKCKNGFPLNFRRSWSTTKIYWLNTAIFPLILFTLGLLCVKFLKKVVDLTTLNILRTRRAMLMSFCNLILQDVRFLLGVATYLFVSADFCL